MSRIIAAVAVIVILVPVTVFAEAQFAIDKGSTLLAGMASMSSSSGDAYGDDNLTVMTVDAKVMPFISPGLAVGGNLKLMSQSYGGSSATLFAIGPTVAYFFGDSTRKTYPYVGASLLFGSLSDSYTETIFGFNGGLSHMVAKNIATSAEVVLQFESIDPEGPRDSEGGTTIGLMIGITCFLF
jgi:hypothetical protein